MVPLGSDQHPNVVVPVPTPCLSFSSVAQSTEKALDPAYVHLPSQLLVVPVPQPVSVLFPLSLCPTFVLLPNYVSLLILSSSTFVLPSTSSLSSAVSILLPATYSFISSSILLFTSFSFSFLILPKLPS